MPLVRKLVLSIFVFLSTSPLMADNLAIPGHYESDNGMNMPHRGASMDKVLEQFGEPVRRIPPVGEPPISEWDYGDFRVYFEYQYVLHSINLKTLIMPQ